MEEKKTDSFTRFIDDKIVNKLTSKNTKKINLDDIDAEWEVLDLITKFYINRTNSVLGNWQTFKEKHKKSFIACTNPNYSYKIYKTKLYEWHKKLNGRAKLHYLQELINEYGFGFVEACLSYVIFIKTAYHKTDYSNFKLSKMYNYLNFALMETNLKTLDDLFNLPVDELIDLLYNNVIKTLFNRNTLDYETYLNLDNNTNINFSYLNYIDDEELFDMANKAFNNRIIEEMHTQSNGMVF